MKAIIGDRQMGKTARMLEWLHDNPDAALLVVNSHEAGRLVGELLYRYGGSPRDWHRRIYATTRWGILRGTPYTKLGIDNLDLVLQTLYPRSVSVVSWTGSPEDVEILRIPPHKD